MRTRHIAVRCRIPPDSEKASSRTPDSVLIRHLSRGFAHGVPTPAYRPDGPAAAGSQQLSPAEAGFSALTRLPCSRLDVHPAAVVSAGAGRLLPYRFTPYPAGSPPGGNALCCSCRHGPMSPPCGEAPDHSLTCCFVRQPCHLDGFRRPPGWESGSSSIRKPG